MNIWTHKHFPAKVLPTRADFNWWCFFLGSLWALGTGTWITFWKYVVLNVVCFAVAAVGSPALSFVAWVVSIAASALFAFEANADREDRLVKIGYERVQP